MNDVLATYSVPRGSETILVAEDDEMLRTLLQIALESCGYSVLASASGPAALELAQRHAEPIALLVSDVIIARRLAAVRPGLKVLLLSGYSRDPALLDAEVDFLQKPFRPSALVARVREILDLAPATLVSAGSTRSTPPDCAQEEAPAGEQPPGGAQDSHAVEACACGSG
jgi:two-component system cell cycle sensor histidine kinase/response regulator CckA